MKIRTIFITVLATASVVRCRPLESAQDIRDSMHLNPNTGASSSSSITNVASIKQPKTLNDGGPNLKLGQGLSVGISVQGPEGPASSNTFADTQMFNTDPGDIGNSFANAGNTGPNMSGTLTGSDIRIRGQPGFGQAIAFNQANANAFGNRGNGGRFTQANANGGVF